MQSILFKALVKDSLLEARSRDGRRLFIKKSRAASTRGYVIEADGYNRRNAFNGQESYDVYDCYNIRTSTVKPIKSDKERSKALSIWEIGLVDNPTPSDELAGNDAIRQMYQEAGLPSWTLEPMQNRPRMTQPVATMDFDF